MTKYAFFFHTLHFAIFFTLTTEGEALFATGKIERNTGGDQNTPPIWERRCGFPTPERNDNGEPVDRAAQIRRLQRMGIGYESGVNQAFAGKFRSDFSSVPMVSSSLPNEG